ncbi:MAG: F0F1 ATP synthase subunit A, partial [Muribaculaceae bacterium]|nr:F0F1 ATP synthase subunit A [Muribaculaceae bacterium]
NIMGGHMIVLVLTLLIFIFAAVSPVAGGGTTIMSVGFSVFMLVIDVLVSFIQAFVFTMLSTIFISLAQEEGHHDDKAHDHQGASAPVAAK